MFKTLIREVLMFNFITALILAALTISILGTIESVLQLGFFLLASIILWQLRKLILWMKPV
jgi:hypothetical protein